MAKPNGAEAGLDVPVAPSFKQLDPPPRLMLGPGPSNCAPRVYQAMAMPQVGHMDPHFLHLMEETQELLRYVWQTKNAFTVPVSGTGSAAWEAAVANLVEAGDVVLYCINGYFGIRGVDMCSRYGADVKTITKPWGEVFSFDEIKEAVLKYKPKILGLVHAETSTGACQPMDGIGQLCRDNDCLLLLDTVTSIGGLPVYLDRWLVDACYAGGQKCLSCPPGIAPLTFSQRALDKMQNRKTPVPNWYLDMNAIAKYLFSPGGAPRTYHHTAPISMIYALRESLRIVAEETLPVAWDRHRKNAELLWAGLEKMGIQLHVQAEHRLPSLTTARIPEGVDGKAVTTYLLTKYNLEMGGGLGELAGKVWRIGLMGFNSRPETVQHFLACLKDALEQQGYKVPA
eukprot:comp12314_c0_seq1/m.7164 comp12314_c0_seq1/g.7164  ORF comp12314_c0_seq1/g.7164 comp12314_c0_seq1/m.7164 type:complete len:398 (-) comp12314_c0_seq1:99-1292(-)